MTSIKQKRTIVQISNGTLWMLSWHSKWNWSRLPDVPQVAS